jgi:hypothetical protein
MGRFAFSIAILSLIGASACETTHAAPMAPLPPDTAGEARAGIITPAHYYVITRVDTGITATHLPAIGIITARTGRGDVTA